MTRPSCGGSKTLGRSSSARPSLTEFAYGVNTPPTRTPWNLECYPGGSSAGSGVAVAIGTAFAAVGTDTGGSIRVPAAINGIVGLKPTYGRVSRYGIVPLATSLDHPGPLTRTVEDCAIFLQAIAGYDPADAGTVDVPVSDYLVELEAGVAGITIGVERAHFFYGGVTDDVRRGVEEAIDHLAPSGSDHRRGRAAGAGLVAPGPDDDLGGGGEHGPPQAPPRAPGRLRPRHPPLIGVGEFISATHYLTAQRARSLLKSRMQNLFAAHGLDALLFPTLPLTTVPIPELHVERPDYPGESPVLSKVHHTFSANLTGQPAAQRALRSGQQRPALRFPTLGRPFDEATVFRIARAYEREYPWSTIDLRFPQWRRLQPDRAKPRSQFMPSAGSPVALFVLLMARWRCDFAPTACIDLDQECFVPEP